MNQSPLKLHNTYYNLTKKSEAAVQHNTKPVFYELEKFNEDWSTTFNQVDLFDHILHENLKNEKFRELVFTDDFASNLQLELQESKDKLQTELLVQFNNFLNDLFFGNVDSIDTRDIKSAMININKDVNFNSPEGIKEALSLLCNTVFSLFPEKLESFRKKDSIKFKREMKEIEFLIKDLKEQFFVEEIRAVFSLLNPPDHLLFALKALAFVMTDRVIDWNDKGFSMKEICDFLLRMKPWTITRSQRIYLKNHFFNNELWDLNKIAKKSQPGVIMARWLQANVQAADLIENVKTQAKHFKIPGKFDYSYYRLPGGANFAVVNINFNVYPRRGNFLALVNSEIINNLQSLTVQGFKNEYLNPGWVLINSVGGITLNELESHRQEGQLMLNGLVTADGGLIRHEVSINPDTGYLMVTAPDGCLVRISEMGPFRVNCMIYV